MFDSLGRPRTHRPPGSSLYARANARIYIWLLLIYFITFRHYWTRGERVRVLQSAQEGPDAEAGSLLYLMFSYTDVWAAAICKAKRNKAWKGDFEANLKGQT